MITKTWSSCGIPLGTAPSSANIGPASRANTRPRVASFFIIWNCLSFRTNYCRSRFSIGIGSTAGNLVQICCCPVTGKVQLCEYQNATRLIELQRDKRRAKVLRILELFEAAVVACQRVTYTRLLSV